MKLTLLNLNRCPDCGERTDQSYEEVCGLPHEMICPAFQPLCNFRNTLEFKLYMIMKGFALFEKKYFVFSRTEKTVNPADPTQTIKWQIGKRTGISLSTGIELNTYWDTVLLTVYLFNREIALPKMLANWASRHLIAWFESMHAIEAAPYVECPTCHLSDALVMGEGYVGEDIQSCQRCDRVIWCEDPTPYII